ncbi:MAG: hypothetical protein JRH14_18020 [Deltaproteobacteria bacterium]|nr:hypothetical protein [Deltaproteobacteria bacterium]MBW2380199.1 hypothetical protein [Deltaproteobacteria bacterium]MBW2550707.1 hypothetical protein [Deltaproteobacteria bacterium]MBW2685851.1 hypothetical protein [Deltaproteobacteria bacterium]
MRYVVFSWLTMFALLSLPFAGCSGSTNEGTGGSGGDAGAGGTAGSGGTAGAGGSEPAPPGLWTGGGQGGADGSFTICFNVREDGNALVRPLDTNQECRGNSLWVEFDTCEGGLSTNEEIPVVDGVFHLLNEQGGLAGYWDISGTIDGNTASGEAEVGAIPDGTCLGSWTATPSP